jgi:hypothetical protein
VIVEYSITNARSNYTPGACAESMSQPQLQQSDSRSSDASLARRSMADAASFSEATTIFSNSTFRLLE